MYDPVVNISLKRPAIEMTLAFTDFIVRVFCQDLGMKQKKENALSSCNSTFVVFVENQRF